MHFFKKQPVKKWYTMILSMYEFQSQTSVRSDGGGGGGPDPLTLPLDPPLH